MRRSPEQPPDPPPCTPTQRQQAFLDRHHLNPERPLDYYEASRTIGQFIGACRQMAPTARQQRFLKDAGKWREGMTRGEAFDAIRGILAGDNGRV